LPILNGDSNVNSRKVVSYKSFGSWTASVFNRAPCRVGSQLNFVERVTVPANEFVNLAELGNEREIEHLNELHSPH
jgi:hypothetical protein